MTGGKAWYVLTVVKAAARELRQGKPGDWDKVTRLALQYGAAYGVTPADMEEARSMTVEQLILLASGAPAR